VRQSDPLVPIIVQSTEMNNRQFADELRAAFIYKQSSSYFLELREKITSGFGFGDFVFRNPETAKVEARIENLKGLQDIIFKISNDCLQYHVSRNDISRWLYSRALFPLAEYLKRIDPAMLGNDMSHVRRVIFDSIVDYRRIKNRGVVAVFDPKKFDQYSNFVRLGSGSMGGKGRGLAFIDAMIKRNTVFEGFENVQITIPRTLVVCSDVFAEFMETNSLYDFALSQASDEAILERFLAARLNTQLIENLRYFLAAVSAPLAVRSSSLLEDSNYQPFAGIYTTYMIPCEAGNLEVAAQMLEKAIKAVFASVYYQASKQYMKVTKNVIDEERMAVVIQEICGSAYGNRFYPSFSGVAQSYNYYPVGAEGRGEGVVNLAFGLGKYIVEGGRALRFSPAHPASVLQTSTVENALRETQQYFYALETGNPTFEPKVDDSFNLLKLSVQEAVPDGSLRYIASTYNLRQQQLYDNAAEQGIKIITFANILKHKVFPLAEILKKILETAQMEMGRPVEIEFAVNLDYSSTPAHTFYLLQVRPTVDVQENLQDSVTARDRRNALVYAVEGALGHGIIDEVRDVIYVRPEKFDAARNPLIAEQIAALNNRLQYEKRPYLLIGPGRWGSSDPWLGVPVKWQHISGVRMMVEAGLPNYRIEPSQGTHFFQNLTSLGVFYYTVNPYTADGSTYNIDLLNAMPALYESEDLRHVRFLHPLTAKICGQKSEGVILVN